MTQKHLQIPIEANNVDLTLRPRGALVVGQPSAVLREILNHLIDHHYPLLVVDLGDVTCIDSGGLGVLVEAHSRGGKMGTEIELDNLPPMRIVLMVLTKLYTTFTVRSSWPKAA